MKPLIPAFLFQLLNVMKLLGPIKLRSLFIQSPSRPIVRLSVMGKWHFSVKPRKRPGVMNLMMTPKLPGPMPVIRVLSQNWTCVTLSIPKWRMAWVTVQSPLLLNKRLTMPCFKPVTQCTIPFGHARVLRSHCFSVQRKFPGEVEPVKGRPSRR